jgi:hypothetical protein
VRDSKLVPECWVHYDTVNTAAAAVGDAGAADVVAGGCLWPLQNKAAVPKVAQALPACASAK